MKASFQDLVGFWAPPNVSKLQALIDTKLKSSEVKPDDSPGVEKTERETEQVDQMELHSAQEPLVLEPHAHRVWANNCVWPMVVIVLGECVPLSSDLLLSL